MTRGHGMGDVTRILSQIEDGDGQAAEQLLPLVYEELRKLAAEKMVARAGFEALINVVVVPLEVRLVG